MQEETNTELEANGDDSQIATVDPIGYMELKVTRAATGKEEIYKFSSDPEIQKEFDIENSQYYDAQKEN